jgi:hypothetical protein
MIAIDKYKKDDYKNPSDYLDPAEKFKNKDFFLRKSEWMYSLYLRDMCFIPYSRKANFIESRLYAQGRQSTVKYMDQLAPKRKIKGNENTNGSTFTDTKFQRKGMMNISWDIESPMPKFRLKVMGSLMQVDYNATAQGIDEQSDYQRNKMKFRKWAIKESAPFLKAVEDATGVTPAEDTKNIEMPFDPESIEQLNMIDKIGGFKLWYEIVMQKLIKWSYDLSEWDQIKMRMIEDAIDLGFIGMKDKTDQFSQRPMVEYVDPEFFVGRQTRFNDFSDLSEGGQIKFYSIQSLRETGEFTDYELRDMAYVYQGQLGNNVLNIPGTYGNYMQANITDHSSYLGFKVSVLDWEFESTDTEVYQTRKDAEGNPMYFKSDFNYNREGKKANSEKYNFKKRKRFYRCKWVIGTKKVYDFGYQYDVPHHSDDEPKCSFSMYRISDRSMVDLCKASLDSLQIAVLKYRNAVSKAKPAGIKVEFGSLSNMTLGGEIMSPLDILTIYRDTGDLLYKAGVDQGGRVLQGTADPVAELKGGMGPILMELITCFDLHLNRIREYTGLNAVVDASTPAQGAQVGTSKIAEAATNDILRPLLGAIKNVKKRGARNMASRWQIVALYAKDEVRAMVTAIGSAYTEIVKIGANEKDAFGLATFGINFEATIDDAMIARVDAAALQSMQAGKSGSPGISMKDYVFILRMLELGEVKLAEVYLAYREQQEKDLIDQRAMQNQQMNSQSAQQLEQLKAQNMKMATDMEIKKETSIIAAKSNADILKIKVEGEENRKTITWEMTEAKRLKVEQQSIA